MARFGKPVEMTVESALHRKKRPGGEEGKSGAKGPRKSSRSSSRSRSGRKK